MTRRTLIATCCALVLAAPMLARAQKPDEAADPITGTWAGDLVLDGRGPVAITMELKFDGKSAVTGTFQGLPNPGDVKAGTFEPKTGALKLQLGKRGEAATLLTLEGTVAKGVATGRFSGDESGTFKLSKKPS
jgi:hypothetical protein